MPATITGDASMDSIFVVVVVVVDDDDDYDDECTCCTSVVLVVSVPALDGCVTFTT